MVPKHFTGGAYSDKDLKDEQELCEINEYSNAAFCPKLSSTNPGIDVYSNPPGYNSARLEAANCKVIDPATKGEITQQIAKYKLSTSCSYSPSILGYYHISRMLGNVLNVPVAVIRTFDLTNHIALGKKALAMTRPADLIHQTWSSLYAQLTQGASALKKDAEVDQQATKAFFEGEALFTSADYVRVRKNLKALVAQLHKACTEGKLNLDLDLALHFSREAQQKPSCDL